MSYTTTVDHAKRRVLVRAQGPITLADVRTHLEEERLGVGLTYSELIDARGFSPAFSPEGVRTLVNILRRLGKDSKLGPTAIIVDTDFGYGMLRLLEVLVEDVCDIRPFRHQEEAEKWLAEFHENVT
jgi:hypothetical protein